MKVMRRIVVTLLSGVLLVGAAVGPVPSAAASDSPAGCTIRYSTIAMSINNGHPIGPPSGLYRAFADHRLQYLDATGCAFGDRVRAVVDIRCQKWQNQEIGWVAQACASTGYVQTTMLVEEDAVGTGWAYSFGTTGPDGITTVYGPDLNIGRLCDEPAHLRGRWISQIRVDRLTIGSTIWSNRGWRGRSHEWPDPPCRPPSLLSHR